MKNVSAKIPFAKFDLRAEYDEIQKSKEYHLQPPTHATVGGIVSHDNFPSICIDFNQSFIVSHTHIYTHVDPVHKKGTISSSMMLHHCGRNRPSRDIRIPIHNYTGIGKYVALFPLVVLLRVRSSDSMYVTVTDPFGIYLGRYKRLVICHITDVNPLAPPSSSSILVSFYKVPILLAFFGPIQQNGLTHFPFSFFFYDSSIQLSVAVFSHVSSICTKNLSIEERYPEISVTHLGSLLFIYYLAGE